MIPSSVLQRKGTKPDDRFECQPQRVLGGWLMLVLRRPEICESTLNPSVACHILVDAYADAGWFGALCFCGKGTRFIGPWIHEEHWYWWQTKYETPSARQSTFAFENPPTASHEHTFTRAIGRLSLYTSPTSCSQLPVCIESVFKWIQA